MSGPKVVRIVTREEIEAICLRHVAGVRAAAAELRRRARRCGTWDAALERSVATRLASFDAMLARDAWMDIQKAAPEAAAFLAAEADRLEGKAAEAAAAARGRGRRATDAARTIAASLAAAGLSAPPGLRAAAEGRSSPEQAEREVAEAFALVPLPCRDSTTDRSQEGLAARLAEGEGRRSMADLLAARPTGAAQREGRLDRIMAELAIMGGAGAFDARANAVGREPDASRKALLVDSLAMDAAAHVAALRGREAASARLRAAAASLEGCRSAEASPLQGRLLAAADAQDTRNEAALVAEAAALVDEDARAVAAASRRAAVLAGLASLGYEVRETMASAWERDGRVVVRKAGATDYGVELAAPADAARLQVRLVGSDRPATARDARRDADQETIWCSDFDRLRQGLATAGAEMVVERALAPGQQALRTVPMASAGEVRATEPGRTATRRAPP